MIRLMGAALLMAGCGGVGFSLAAAHRKETGMLRRLIRGVQEMEWELRYRMTALPDLCRIAGDAAGGALRDIFRELADMLDRREVTEITGCVNGILQNRELPRRVRRNMKQLGRSLGRFDLEGQLEGLQLVRQQCRKDLQELEENSADRLRNYQTLALCAGAALAILFI